MHMNCLSISLESCWLCRLCCQIISKVDKFPLYLSLRGFLHEKTCTSASFILGWLFHFVSCFIMTGSFHISVFEGTLQVVKIHMWFKIANIAHALPIPVYQQTDFTPKHVVSWHLHDTIARFRTRVKFSPQQPGWTHTRVICPGMTFCGGIM